MNMEALGRLDPSALSDLEKTPMALVLDNVRSGLNVGSAFRTADAFAVGKIYLCGITATPPHREILKTALGATDTVAWEYHESAVTGLASLKALGYRIWAVEQAAGSTPLQTFSPEPGARYALVFGNEVNGVSEDVMEMVEGAIEIPQFGTKHSLNIAVSVGIVVWDVFSKMRFGYTSEI